ncbi:MAG: nitrilase-related carbon-nitrogen hydrolase, partial [Pseudomonadota bacterium]
MRVTSIQMKMRDRPKKENIEVAISLLDRAPESDLILLPEIWPVGFFRFDQYRTESEEVEGPIVQAFREKASERACHILMGSFVE